MKRLVFLAIMGLPLAAQAPAQNAGQAAAQDQQNDQPDERRADVYVRRISAGIGIAAVLPGPTIEENLQQSFTTTPPLEIQSRNEAKSSKVGYSAVVQVALTERWAVAVAPMLRTKFQFESSVVRYVGNDNPNTIQDDREGTNLTVRTSAKALDVPVLARYYFKDRSEPGFRWFGEFGPRIRRVYSVRTNTRIQPPPGKGDVFTTDDPVSYRQMIPGASAGLGFQFTDDFGIRFVPEVRYTRWFGKNFGDITGRSRQHQVEVIFTLSF